MAKFGVLLHKLPFDRYDSQHHANHVGAAMSEDNSASDPLIEWNRLNKENSENLGASKVFVALLTKFPAELGNYASWFTAGVGAVVVLLLSSVDKVAPYLGEVVYARSIAAFGAAVFFGALSKLFATYVTALISMQEEITKELQDTFMKFEADATKIRDMAKQRNLDLNTEFDLLGLMKKIQSQVGLTMGIIMGWVMKRASRSNNPILYRFRMPVRFVQVEALCFALSVAAAICGTANIASAISEKALGLRHPPIAVTAANHADTSNSPKH